MLAFLFPAGAGCGRPAGDADLWRGFAGYRRGAYAAAQDRFESAARRKPGDPAPLFNAGDARYRQDQFAEAEAAFAPIAQSERAPARVRSKAYHNLGNSLFRQQRFPDAAEAYKRCLILDPADEDCRHNLVLALRPPESCRQPKKDPKKQDQPPKEDPKKSPQGGEGRPPERPDKPRPQSGLSQEDSERVLQAVREREKDATRAKPAWRGKPQPKAAEFDW